MTTSASARSPCTEGVFKSRVLDTDGTFSFTFDKPGTYPYFCSVHPKMTGRGGQVSDRSPLGKFMVNPFDRKAALLAKHAQHVVLIHFPIALYLSGTF